MKIAVAKLHDAGATFTGLLAHASYRCPRPSTEALTARIRIAAVQQKQWRSSAAWAINRLSTWYPEAAMARSIAVSCTHDKMTLLRTVFGGLFDGLCAFLRYQGAVASVRPEARAKLAQRAVADQKR